MNKLFFALVSIAFLYCENSNAFAPWRRRQPAVPVKTESRKDRLKKYSDAQLEEELKTWKNYPIQDDITKRAIADIENEIKRREELPAGQK